MRSSYDVVIVGGAVMGSALACHLAEAGFGRDVLVLEPDPSYARCASALSAASIRQQYSSEINVRISLYGIAFLREIGCTEFQGFLFGRPVPAHEFPRQPAAPVFA